MTGFASATFGEKWKTDEAEKSEGSDEFLPGEEGVWDVADAVTDQLKASLRELPGCQRLSIGHSAPLPA